MGYYLYEPSNDGETTMTTLSNIAATPLQNPQTLQTVKIKFAGVILVVELATTSADQQRGLSGRDSMPEDHGMLFVFSQEGQWGFWMIDMKFPLDIIWFNSTKQVVFIEQNLPPCTPAGCPVFSPPVNSRYVLEVNAGFVIANGVSLGVSFAFIQS
jgi:uncharacterized membrane protein (UPF0127 family)